jgi:phage-related protein
MPINPFIYSRNSSIDKIYSTINVFDLLPIYGSSVTFSSRVNFLQTIDNSIKVQPNSENNLIVKFNLKFLLTDLETGSLLKTIEMSKGTKYLKFSDPSDFYESFTGLCQDYKLTKESKNLNLVEIVLINNHSAPIFNWSKSSFLKNINNQNNLFSTSKAYNKYDIIYHEDLSYFLGNKSDNFWFAKKNVATNNQFSLNNFTKNFFYETKYPFEVSNALDVKSIEYKNSFSQYVNQKTNVNTLKNFPIKFENISDLQARSILFFLEKKMGYRKFIYEFPLYFNKNKIFICLNWRHVFNYFDSHEITMELNEDPTGEEVVYKNGEYFINSN